MLLKSSIRIGVIHSDPKKLFCICGDKSNPFSVSMIFFVPVIYVAVELGWHDHSDEELRNKFENLSIANMTEI